jgi:hypothetical protein
MVNISMDNLFYKALPIMRIDPTYCLSFPLFAKNWVKKSRAHLALPSFRPRVSAPVALQQSRILRTSDIIITYFLGSLLKGDISTLRNWVTFLLCTSRDMLNSLTYENEFFSSLEYKKLIYLVIMVY